MAVPVLVQKKQAVAGTSGSSISVTLDSAPTEGNLLVGFCNLRKGGTGVTWPTGWTEVASIDQQGSTAAGGNGSADGQSIATRVVEAGESATVTASGGTFTRRMIQVYEISGGEFSSVNQIQDAFGEIIEMAPVTPAAGVDALLIAVFEWFEAVSRTGSASGYSLSQEDAANTGDDSDYISGWTQDVTSATGDPYASSITTASAQYGTSGQVAIIASGSAPPPPASVADFVGAPTFGNAPLTVDFTDRSTGDPTEWLWSFGDGETSTEQSPTHVYGAEGAFTVALLVNGTDLVSKFEYITVDLERQKPIQAWRVVLYAMGVKRGRGARVAVIEDASSVGGTIMYNSPGEGHWTLGLTHPQLGECEPKQRHYAIEFFDGDEWTEKFVGLLWDFDATDQDITFKGVDYLGLLQFNEDERFDPDHPAVSFDAPSDLGSKYVDKTISFIIQNQVERHIGLPDSPVGFIKIGQIDELPERVTITAAFQKTLPLAAGLVDSHRQGQGHRTRISVDRAPDGSFKFNLRENPGVDRANFVLRYGELLSGYEIIPFGNAWGSVAIGIGRSREGLKLYYKTESAPQIDQPTWGRFTQETQFPDISDQNDLQRRLKQFAIKMGQIGRALGLRIATGRLAPLSGFDVCDSFPVEVIDGSVDTRKFGSSLWTCWGVTWEGFDDGHWETILTISPKEDATKPDPDLLSSGNEIAPTDWAVSDLPPDPDTSSAHFVYDSVTGILYERQPDSSYVAIASLQPGVITTEGDLIIGGTDGVPERLPAASDGYVLAMLTGRPYWFPAGDIIANNYVDFIANRNSAGTRGRIPVTTTTPYDHTLIEAGTTGQVLTMGATDPEWQDSGSGVALSDATPIVESGSGASGTGTEASRDDHVHPDDGGGGGGGMSVPTIVQYKRAGTGAITTIVLDTAPTNGNCIVVAFDGFNTGFISALSSTNTTWTELKQFTTAGGAKLSLWVGVVAGGAGGTTISFTNPNSFTSATAIEITDALTPTLGANSTGSTFGDVDLAATTAGHLIVSMFGVDNTTLFNYNLPSIVCTGIHYGIVSLVVGYSQGHPINVKPGPNAGGTIIAEVT
jgi:PKD repeat protein